MTVVIAGYVRERMLKALEDMEGQPFTIEEGRIFCNYDSIKLVAAPGSQVVVEYWLGKDAIFWETLPPLISGQSVTIQASGRSEVTIDT
jgi:hypothetical protein